MPYVDDKCHRGWMQYNTREEMFPEDSGPV